jgi:hypothetical protein
MFLLVNTFHRIPGDTAGHIVSKHRSERKAFERKRLESRKALGTLGMWLVVVDLEGNPCPKGTWAPANTGKVVEWEGQ